MTHPLQCLSKVFFDQKNFWFFSQNWKTKQLKKQKKDHTNVVYWNIKDFTKFTSNTSQKFCQSSYQIQLFVVVFLWNRFSMNYFIWYWIHDINSLHRCTQNKPTPAPGNFSQKFCFKMVCYLNIFFILFFFVYMIFFSFQNFTYVNVII